MRLLLIATALAVLPFAARAEVNMNWSISGEREIVAAPGVSYHKYALATKRGAMYLHTVSISPSSGHTVMPVIANGRLNSVAPVSSLAKGVDAVAAINGGFFDTGKTRLPVGLVKIKRRIIFEQFLNRAVLGIDEFGQVHFDRFVLHSHMFIPGVDSSTSIHGYNRKRKQGEIIVYTPEFGANTATNEWGVELILHRISPDSIDKPFILLEPDRYVISAVSRNNSEIPPDGVVVSIHRPVLDKLEWLDNVYLGMEVQLRSNVPPGWESFPYLLGGGPLLLSDGKIALDPIAENFSKYFLGPNARTAVGRRADGTSVIVVVDKSGGSGGASWDELAVVMRDLLKCSDAMGFDGGGSSTMFVGDEIVNAPSGGGQRQVANILAVVPFDQFI